MKSNNAAVLSFAEKCKNILSSNWQAQLHTIKGNAVGSEDIYNSKVKYIMMGGRPYVWIPREDLHNMNAMFDERGSLSVASPYPGALGKLLKLINKFPSRVAMAGEIVPVSDKKAGEVAECVKEFIRTEEQMVQGSSHAVHSLIGSSNMAATSRSYNLKELVDSADMYSVYKFNIRKCMFMDAQGFNGEVDVKEMNSAEVDPLALWCSSLVDGINRSESRRRALILFCLGYMNANVRDALLTGVDRKGMEVMGKVPARGVEHGDGYQWKDFRVLFPEEAPDLESLCHTLLHMEHHVVTHLLKHSGLDLT